MPTPTIDPNHPAPANLSPADAYQPGQRVWVHRSGCWRPGVVLHASLQAVTVRYRPGDGRGTGVDTVTGRSLTARAEEDPYLDALTQDGLSIRHVHAGRATSLPPGE